MLQYNPSISGSLSVTGSLIVTNGVIGTVNGVDVQIFSSSISQVVTNIQTTTGSQDGRLTSIESFTSSVSTTNTFTSSTSARLSSIETVSASNLSRLSSIETITASNISRLNSIETITASNISRLTSLEITTGSLATTGSNTFIGTQTITGSLFISSNLIVQGTSSLQNITASAVSIGTNLINLNTANPAIRYAGLVIGDSGSVGGSGSFLYDSVQDEMIFVHRGTSTVVTSSVTLMGPQTYDNVGNETYPTLNIIQKGTGNEHLVDSCIQDTNGVVTIGGTLCTSGIICSSNLEVKQSSNNRLVIDCVSTANQPRISSLDSSNNPQYLTINSYDLKINANSSEALRITDTKQFIVGATSMAYPNCLGYVAGFMSDFTGQSVVSIARKGQTLASQGMFIGIDSTSSYFWNRDNVGIQLGTNDTTKMTIACTGQITFACTVCAPQYITTQGSSVSYAAGTNYTIWNSEIENCIQDSNNPAAYTRIKTWVADRSGCATIRYTGYIQSGPTYWGYRVTRNGTSSYMCVGYSDCVQPGCAAANVHGYSSYQFNVGPFLPGDCIGLDVVSTGGGATPSVGQGQWIFAKEFRVFSSTPNLSAGTAGNVFGEWVGIGTCTPFSNLYINGNNPALYDATVDNGQDGCGLTLTVRNNSTVTNSFAQLNLQVSGDSGRAVGRIALIRKDSASSHMAFVIETANSKIEVMRMGCYGSSSHNFIMVGRTNAGISAGTGITLNATTGQIESSVTGDDILNLNRNVSDGKIIRLFKNCVEVGSISTNANSLPSDINFKTNINNLDLGLNLVNKLRPVSYNHKVDDSGSALSTGFIAQEMQCVLDELGVEKNKYFILQHKPVENQNESQYWVDYTKMIPVLTKAIQEQQCTIDSLKTCLGIS
jgi:hypothetical protein